MSLSIIIPCRNEEESIENTINEITYHLINTISDFEINLINDFSSDDTLEKLKIISKTNNKIKV